MNRYFLAVLCICLAVVVGNGSTVGMIDCASLVSRARELYNQGFYLESLQLVSQVENAAGTTGTSCMNRDFYELKAKLYLELNETDASINDAMRSMIREDPTYDAISVAGGYSQAFCNRFRTFRVYPNVQAGFGATLSGIFISSRRELAPIFQPVNGSDLRAVRPKAFAVTGLTAFASVSFCKHLAGKFELTQNFPAVTQSEYSLDADNRIRITESVRSRAYSVSLVGNLGVIGGYHSRFLSSTRVELGYQAFNVYGSSSRYEWFDNATEQGISTRYTNEVDTKPFRKNYVHGLMAGVSYEPARFINNRRIKLIVNLKGVFGLSDYNRIENRFDNQVSTQLYYYAEDRFSMQSLQLQMLLAYNVHYHKKIVTV